MTTNTERICKYCGEPITTDPIQGWVHVANPQLKSWYYYCELNRNHADHKGSGMTKPEPVDD